MKIFKANNVALKNLIYSLEKKSQTTTKFNSFQYLNDNVKVLNNKFRNMKNSVLIDEFNKFQTILYDQLKMEMDKENIKINNKKKRNLEKIKIIEWFLMNDSVYICRDIHYYGSIRVVSSNTELVDNLFFTEKTFNTNIKYDLFINQNTKFCDSIWLAKHSYTLGNTSFHSELKPIVDDFVCQSTKSFENDIQSHILQKQFAEIYNNSLDQSIKLDFSKISGDNPIYDLIKKTYQDLNILK